MLRKSKILLAFIIVATAITSADCVFAQGWGEQATLGFRYNTQGVSNETARVQLGATIVSQTASLAAAARSSGSSSGSAAGSGQSSDMLNNVVQITNNASYNVQLNGTGNYLNFDTKVDANQSSQDSSMTSSNNGTSYQTITPRASNTNTYLNR
jgi:hypothetical protein